MEENRLDLRGYWGLLLKWWWVLLFGGLGAAVVAFFVSGTMTPIYEASVKVLVQSGQTPGAPYLTDIEASQQLADNYRDLVKTRTVLEQVVEELSLPYGSGKLDSKIHINSSRSLIKIRVSDPDPELAAMIADTTAQSFIDEFRSRQFTQIAQFQASLSQFGITEDTGIIAAQASTLSTLSVVEGAKPPSSPSRPRTILNVSIAAILGLLVAGLVVLLLEHLDDTIKSPDQLKSLTGMAILGSVNRHQGSDGKMPLVADEKQRHSPLVESYKFLQTNLEFAATDIHGSRSLLITSSSPEEGKTTTAVNLAVSMAREGKRVVLVDADLRKPSLNQLFDLGSHAGLTNLISGSATLEEALADTSVENLRVIPTGPLPPDATLVLRSPKMKGVLEELETKADIIIFDSPPLLSVTDPMLVAPLVDGALLVVDVHRTGIGTVKRGAETLIQASPAVVGTVLNKVTAQGGAYYSYYYYNYSYYAQDGTDGHRPGRLAVISRLFRRGRKSQTGTQRSGKRAGLLSKIFGRSRRERQGLTRRG